MSLRIIHYIKECLQVVTDGWDIFNVLPYIFIIIKQEAAQDVNSQNLKSKNKLEKRNQSCWTYWRSYQQTHPQSTFRFDVHYCQHSLVQDSIAYIFARLRVCCNLCAQSAALSEQIEWVQGVRANRLLIKSYLCKNVIHCFTWVIVALA